MLCPRCEHENRPAARLCEQCAAPLAHGGPHRGSPSSPSGTFDLRRLDIVDAEMARVLRAKSGLERLRLAHEAWELARARLTAFLSAQHPDWAPDEVRREVAKRLSRESG